MKNYFLRGKLSRKRITGYLIACSFIMSASGAHGFQDNCDLSNDLPGTTIVNLGSGNCSLQAFAGDVSGNLWAGLGVRRTTIDQLWVNLTPQSPTDPNNAYVFDPAHTASNLFFPASFANECDVDAADVTITANTGISITDTDITDPSLSYSLDFSYIGNDENEYEVSSSLTHNSCDITITNLTKLTQTITIDAPSKHGIPKGDFSVTATSTSGLTTALTSDTPLTCSVDGTTVTPVGEGICTITAAQDGDNTYDPALPISVDISLKKWDQGTFINFTDTSLTVALQNPSFTYSSDLNHKTYSIAYDSTSDEPLVIALIEALDQRSANPSFDTSLAAINALDLAVNAGLAEKELVDRPTPITYESLTPSLCAINQSKLITFAEGECLVKVSQIGNYAYNASIPKTLYIRIVKTNPGIWILLAEPDVPYVKPSNYIVENRPGTTIEVYFTAYSEAPVSLTATPASVCKYSGPNNFIAANWLVGQSTTYPIEIIGTGSCLITASQPDSTYYLETTKLETIEIVDTFNVIASPTTIAINDTSALSINGGIDLGLYGYLGINSYIVTDGTDKCSISGSTVTGHAAGTCTVTATKNFGASHTANSEDTVVITVSAFNQQSITINAPSNHAMGDGNIPVTATSTSGLPVSLTSNTPLTCSVNGTNVIPVSEGTCTITATQSGNNEYDPAPTESVTINIEKSDQTVTINAPSSHAMANGNISVTATSTSGLPVILTSNTPLICSVNGTNVIPVSEGTCTITATQSGNNAYDPAPAVSVTISLEKLDQTITFDPISDHIFSPDIVIDLNASSSSGLPVSFTLIDGGGIGGLFPVSAICTIANNQLTVHRTGSCTIRASQAGNTHYNASALADRSFSINKADQTITFPQLTTKPFTANATFTPNISSDSGLEVLFTASPSNVCEAIPSVGSSLEQGFSGPGFGSTVKMIDPGICTLTTSQSGLSGSAGVSLVFNYNPAPTVVRQVEFIEMPSGVTVTDLNNTPLGISSTPSTVGGIGGIDVSTGSAQMTYRLYNNTAEGVEVRFVRPDNNSFSTNYKQKFIDFLSNLSPISSAMAIGEEDFTVAPNPLFVPAYSSAEYTVTFNPTAEGLREMELQLLIDDNVVLTQFFNGIGILSDTEAGSGIKNIPVFNPIGLLAAILGLLWFGRRRVK